jgi:hypothetical protein
VIDLIILACLISAPDQCRHYTAGQGETIHACQAQAMVTAALWSSQHPAYEIRRIVCSGHGEDA